MVRLEVSSQLEAEQKILREAVGLAAKIVAGAIALLLGIFTLFSLTTWRDIKSEVTATVRKQSEDLIQRADSETSVKEVLNDLYNRSVIGAALIRHNVYRPERYR